MGANKHRAAFRNEAELLDRMSVLSPDTRARLALEFPPVRSEPWLVTAREHYREQLEQWADMSEVARWRPHVNDERWRPWILWELQNAGLYEVRSLAFSAGASPLTNEDVRKVVSFDEAHAWPWADGVKSFLEASDSKIAGRGWSQLPFLWSCAWLRDAANALRACLKTQPGGWAVAFDGIRRVLPSTKDHRSGRELVAAAVKFVSTWPETHGWCATGSVAQREAPLALLASTDLLCSALHDGGSGTTPLGLADALDAETLALLRAQSAERRATPFARAMAVRLLLARGVEPGVRASGELERYLADDERVSAVSGDPVRCELLAVDRDLSPLARIRALGHLGKLAPERVDAVLKPSPVRGLAEILSGAEEEVQAWTRAAVDPFSLLFGACAALRTVVVQIPKAPGGKNRRAAPSTVWRWCARLERFPVLPWESIWPRWEDMAFRLRGILVDSLPEDSPPIQRHVLEVLLRADRILGETSPHRSHSCAVDLARLVVGRLDRTPDGATRYVRPLITPLQSVGNQSRVRDDLAQIRDFLEERYDRDRAAEVLGAISAMATSPAVSRSATEANFGKSLILLCGETLHLSGASRGQVRALVRETGPHGFDLKAVPDIEVRLRAFRDGNEVLGISARSGSSGIASWDFDRDAVNDGDTIVVSLSDAPSRTATTLVRKYDSELQYAPGIRGDPRDAGLIVAAASPRPRVTVCQALSAGLSGARVLATSGDGVFAPLVIKVGPASAMSAEFEGYRAAIACTLPGVSYGVLPPRFSGACGVLVYNLIENPQMLEDALRGKQTRRHALTLAVEFLDRLCERWWCFTMPRSGSWEAIHPDETIPRWQVGWDSVKWTTADPVALSSLDDVRETMEGRRKDLLVMRVASVTTKAIKLDGKDGPPNRIRVALQGDWRTKLERYPELTRGKIVGLRARVENGDATDLRSKLLGATAKAYTELVARARSWPRGTVHGDLHPRNIALTLKGERRAALLDFAHSRREDACAWLDLAKLELYCRLWAFESADGRKLWSRASKFEDAVDSSDASPGNSVPKTHVELIRQVRTVASRIQAQLQPLGQTATYAEVLSIIGISMLRFAKDDNRRHPLGSAWVRVATERAARSIPRESGWGGLGSDWLESLSPGD